VTVPEIPVNINIVKPFLPSLEEIAPEMGKILQSGLVTNNSPFVRLFEERLQQFFGSTLRPTLFCNGEMGLYHLLQAWKHKLGYGPHQTFDVLVPSFTFSGTVNAIVMNNLRPVFCDVDETLTLAVRKLKADSPDIRMIVAVGAYGNLPDLEELGRFADDNKLVLILDNAPAFGSKFRGRFPCTYGYSEMISLHATKIFTSMEGGVDIVNDPEIQDYLTRLRDYGQFEKVRGNIDLPGLNSKMQEISALVGLKNLEKVDFILGSRQANVERYRAHFEGLERRGLIKTMLVKGDVHCTYLYFPILLQEDATRFVDFMQRHGVAVRRYYTANHTLDFYRGRYREQDLTQTERIRDNVVSLPLHTVMSEAELGHLFGTVDQYFGG
jgi:dTDP-4-amino-4,6-dideoxygalactose transaminase